MRRRKFYEWLNGPGRALKQPLPGSTNYLGAYDRFGNLVRGTLPEKDTKKPEEPKGEAEGEGEAAASAEGQEAAEVLEDALQEHKKEEQTAAKKDGARLQPETMEDLRPFPLNKWFRSQPVLSEDLREAIYHFVVTEGKTVALASVTFGVSNERVGAVVRLKQMEKQWIASVSLHPACRFRPPFHDEHTTFD